MADKISKYVLVFMFGLNIISIIQYIFVKSSIFNNIFPMVSNYILLFLVMNVITIYLLLNNLKTGALFAMITLGLELVLMSQSFRNPLSILIFILVFFLAYKSYNEN